MTKAFETTAQKGKVCTSIYFTFPSHEGILWMSREPEENNNSIYDVFIEAYINNLWAIYNNIGEKQEKDWYSILGNLFPHYHRILWGWLCTDLITAPTQELVYSFTEPLLQPLHTNIGTHNSLHRTKHNTRSSYHQNVCLKVR